MNLGRAEHPFHAAAPKPARPNSSPWKSVEAFGVCAENPGSPVKSRLASRRGLYSPRSGTMTLLQTQNRHR